MTPSLLGVDTPRLSAFIQNGKLASVTPVLPAVTCSVQASYLRGTYPSEHGVVGNGWFFRDELEIKFWRQSNRLVERPKIWERAGVTCSNVCWWFNMYSSVDWAVTPRPMYPADGRKLPDVWTHPGHVRHELHRELGQFPLFKFWGPATDISSTRWIADASMWIDRRYHPTLTLVYLPHLDYVLQRLGPGHPEVGDDVREVDAVCGDLIDYYTRAGAQADPDAWFSYYFWRDDRRAPDYARTVDIHRKPGYDPVELFLDPPLRAPKLAIGWTLLRRQLGFRTLLEVTPLDASLVRAHTAAYRPRSVRVRSSRHSNWTSYRQTASMPSTCTICF